MKSEHKHILDDFDRAAQMWGWQAFQGTIDTVIKESKANYELRKALLIKLINKLEKGSK